MVAAKAVTVAALLVPLPSLIVGSAYAILGPTIYIIGGSINDIPLPHIWLLDCRFQHWRHDPSMCVDCELTRGHTALDAIMAGRWRVGLDL